MEIELREWMILIGGVLILLVIVDGVRKIRNHRKNAIKLARRARHTVPPLFDEDLARNPELLGPARTRPREAYLDPLFDPHPDDDEEIIAVPVLMDPVRLPDDAPKHSEKPQQVELFAGLDGDDQETGKEADHVAEPAEVIVINVMDSSGTGIPGKRLLELLLSCQVRFGHMNIFHRFVESKTSGKTVFSIANLVEPGTFDLDNMDSFSTPGVCIFMRLPTPIDAQEAFRMMLNTAQVLAEQLGANLLDDQHHKLRQQSLEQMLQRINEFERRRLRGS